MGNNHIKKCKNMHNKQFHSEPCPSSTLFLPPPLIPVTVFIGFVCILPKFRYENTSICDLKKIYFPPFSTKVPHIHCSIFLLLFIQQFIFVWRALNVSVAGELPHLPCSVGFACMHKPQFPGAVFFWSEVAGFPGLCFSKQAVFVTLYIHLFTHTCAHL